MRKICIAIIGASEIAYRRFLPALKKHEGFEYAGVAFEREQDREKANLMKESFGGTFFDSYMKAIEDPSIDALYIPQPPALHFRYALKALNRGKHVLLEKPFTTSIRDTEQLLDLAKQKNLAVHENYMFRYHKIIKKTQEIISSGILGDIREYRLSFGFPGRAATDFRYNKALGGGALLDCGGYPLCLAGVLLGDSARIAASSLRGDSEHEVDMFGSAMLTNDKGVVAYVAFGMDNAYKCELFAWGSKGTLTHERIFTAPEGLPTSFSLKIGNEESKIEVEGDDSFLSSINVFYENIIDPEKRIQRMDEIRHQAKLVEDCRRKG